MKTYSKGLITEFIASLYLKIKGYKILKKRFSLGKGTNRGEIDLIAKKGKTIVFIEVKQRTTIDEAKYSIFQTQMERIIKSAEAFLKYNSRYRNFNQRFDAICFSKKLKFIHIKNAWTLNNTF